MKQILTICALVFFSFVFSQNSQLVEIETNEGNIFLDSSIEEDEDGYVLKHKMEFKSTYHCLP